MILHRLQGLWMAAGDGALDAPQLAVFEGGCCGVALFLFFFTFNWRRVGAPPLPPLPLPLPPPPPPTPPLPLEEVAMRDDRFLSSSSRK